VDYEFLDAGDGRRLERFGEFVVDRPAPGAHERPRLHGERWRSADGAFDRVRGWQWAAAPPPTGWLVRIDGLNLELRAAAGGQVGLFPEHVAMWPWLRDRAHGASVLNLFAYTGASTLAIAAAGASVAHVDAARTAVAWGQSNARRSALDDAGIRWLVDDAPAFAAREVRRGRRYTGVILDPPSYGHAGASRTWRIERDLQPLLDTCTRLLESPGWVLLTSHTPGLTSERLAVMLDGRLGGPVEHGRLELHARSGARLALGAYARGPAA
jgi:23S rRNA (cytosine1962-C5)-methyltransferase